MVRIRPTAEVADAAAVVAADAVAELAHLVPAATVEHVGATAFIDGWTKGDVDLSVVVPAADFDGTVAVLRRHCDMAQPENWTATFASFSVPGRALPLGLQVAVAGSSSDFLVDLCELFRSRPDLREAYDATKLATADQGAEACWQAKDAFLADVLAEHLPSSAPVADRAADR